MFIVGTLKGWTVVDELHRINASTLIINGYYDEAQDIAVQPFFDLIPKVKWFQFAQSSHTPHFEEKELCLKVMGGFLTADESTSMI
jgi:L-proline amide hydrolase